MGQHGNRFHARLIAVAGAVVLGVGVVGCAAGSVDAAGASGLRDAADCVTDPAAAGELAFSAGRLEVAEGAGDRAVLVLRRNGSTGPVNATITAADGLATSGSDYGAVPSVVHFDDGDGTVEVIRVPIVQDTEDEPPETLRLTLTDPDCGTLGAITTVEITILDDDLATTFTVGGTVTGLEGTGLVLRNNFIDETEPVDGQFTFERGLLPGAGYDVEIGSQPANPVQECSVVNGEGVMPEANVVDVRVECVTAPVSGFLDPSFGQDGVALTPGVRGSVAVAIQPDGSIVTAGDNSLARYLPDGTLDPAFGDGGTVVTGLDTAFAGSAMDVALQPDGGIVVAGVVDNRAAGTKEDFGVRRYDRNGVPDNGFGGGNIVTTDFAAGTDRAYAVAVLPDGGILVGGHAADAPFGGSDFALARYLPNGDLDPAFGDGGRVVTDVGGPSDFGFALAMQADGKPVLTGRAAINGGSAEVAAVVRYTPAGIPDDTFDGDGILLTSFGMSAEAVAIDSTGRLLLAGSLNGGFASTRSDFALVRLDPTGAVDLSFDGDGLVTTDFPRGEPTTPTSNDEFAHDIVIQTDGAIVTVGTAQLDVGADLAMSRHLPDGTLDSSFGAGGRVTVDFYGGFDSGFDVAVQPTDGRLVAVGSALNVFSVENAVIRLQ